VGMRMIAIMNTVIPKIVVIDKTIGGSM